MIDNYDQLDTDADSQGDACDSDDDGFQDVDDPAPLGRSRPGDYSAPEAILNNPIVENALQGAEAAGGAIRTETALKVIQSLFTHVPNLAVPSKTQIT